MNAPPSSMPAAPQPPAPSRLALYLDLIRWNRPAGWLLLLWPSLAALWVAADGFPGVHLVVVFVLGTILMRSAGCCVNDVADRKFDVHVKRTAQRPVTSGRIGVKEALAVGGVLAFVAFLLVLSLNIATIAWSIIGLALTVMLILGASVALGLPQGALRVIFWIGLGLVAGSFLKFGIMVVAGAVAGLIALNAITKGGRETLALCRDSLADGAKTALPVGIACALVGVIIGTMTLTGAANTFGQFIVGVGESSLFLSLVLTMLTCIVLGMGIPTIPNYIITSSIAGPALLELGVPLIVTHMFVFYFGILADLTPPVALACFAAAPIAKESGLKISLNAVKIAAAGFVIPYMAVYSPALMLQPGGPVAEAIGFIPAVIYVVAKAALSIGLWGVAVIGWLGRPLALWERALAMAAAFTLIASLPLTDEIGFALVAAFAGVLWLSRRRGAAA